MAGPGRAAALLGACSGAGSAGSAPVSCHPDVATRCGWLPSRPRTLGRLAAGRSGHYRVRPVRHAGGRGVAEHLRAGCGPAPTAGHGMNPSSGHPGPLALVGGGQGHDQCSCDAELLAASGGSDVLIVPTASAYEHPEKAVASAIGYFDGLGARARGVMVLAR